MIMNMQHPATPLRATIYARQSLDKQGLELGVDRQEAECRRLADARGYTVTEVIRDNYRSASVGDRPGYKRLLDMIETRAIYVVFVMSFVFVMSV